MKEANQVILRTYKSVWDFERKIHSFEGIKLLIPININDALYFLIGVVIMAVFSKVMPFVSKVNFAVRYLIAPYGIMKYLTKQKLDGKYPHKFFFDLIIYTISPKKYYRFRPREEYKKKINFTPVVARNTHIVDKTVIALNSKNKKKRKQKNEEFQSEK